MNDQLPRQMVKMFGIYVLYKLQTTEILVKNKKLISIFTLKFESGSESAVARCLRKVLQLSQFKISDGGAEHKV